MDRPRRVVKQTNRGPVQVATISTSSRPVLKRNVPAPVDPDKQIKTLLQSSKSDLVNLDMADIINSQTWAMLSDESKDCLKTLLPPSVFMGFQESVSDDHPIYDAFKETAAAKSGDASAQSIGIEVTGTSDVSVAEQLSQGFFTDPQLLSAMRTFQDHLYLNRFSPAHQEKVKQFVEGVTNGTLSAPRKDEVWERDNMVPNFRLSVATGVCVPGSISSAKAGGAAEVKLSKLVKNGIVRVGDVLAYKRSFASPMVIEKDCIIESAGPSGISVSFAPGRTKSLPPDLLSDPPVPPSDTPQALHPQSVTITSPSMLETLLLDIEGQLEKSKRPNGNAWKCFSVWRWRKTGFSDCSSAEADKRGGRENHGTLFYLRGSFYNEHNQLQSAFGITTVL